MRHTGRSSTNTENTAQSLSGWIIWSLLPESHLIFLIADFLLMYMFFLDIIVDVVA